MFCQEVSFCSSCLINSKRYAMFNTFPSFAFNVLMDYFYQIPSCCQQGRKSDSKRLLSKAFPDSGYSFFNSLLLALFQALINFTKFRSRLCMEHYIHMITVIIPFFQNNPIPEAICFYIPFALSEIGLSMTFLRYLTTMIR